VGHRIAIQYGSGIEDERYNDCMLGDWDVILGHEVSDISVREAGIV
jgi:hypothetical protein